MQSTKQPKSTVLEFLIGAREALNAGIAQVDTEGRFTAANDRYCEIVGYSHEEIVQLTVAHITHPDDWPRNYELFKEAISEGNNFIVEKRYCRKDGAVIWVNNSVSVVTAASGERFITAICIDITAQKLAGNVLRENVERYATVIEASDLGIWDFDVKEQKLVGAGKMAEIYGLASNDEYNLAQVLQSIHPDDRPEQEELYPGIIESRIRSTMTTSYRIIQKNTGRVRWIKATARAIFDSNGFLHRTVGTVADITEQKIAEDALLYRTALLEAQNEAIPDAILIVDTRGNILSHNKHFAELWGIPKSITDARDDAAALGLAMAQVADPQGFIDKVNYCYAHPDEPAHEEVLLKDGRIIERYGNAVKGEDGTTYGWIWYFRDVTERKIAETALRDSEDRYQNFISQSTEGIWRFELIEPIDVTLPPEKQVELFFQHGYLAECNNAMAQLYGYSSATDLVGLRLADFFPRDQNSEAYFLHLITSGYSVQNAESKEFDKAGEVKYFSNNLLGIIEDGLLVRAWGTQHDITMQKLAEEKIRESEERFRIIADVTPNMVWSINADGTTRYANRYTLDYFGLTDENFPPQWSGLIHPEDLEQVSATIQDAFAEGKGYRCEFRLLRHDGAYRYFVASAAPAYLSDGVMYAYIGTTVDIHEIREAQQKLSESESRFRSLANDTPAFMFLADADTNLEFVNYQWLKFVGLQSEEGLGKSWEGITHPDDIVPMYSIYSEAVTKLKPYQFEIRQKRAEDNAYRWVLWNGIPRKTPDGKFAGMMGVGIDVTNQREFAQQLETLVAERTKALQQSNEDLQQFAHVASHDLKEPVRKIKTFTLRLEKEMKGLLDEKNQQFLTKVNSAADRMISMIDGVLTYSTLNGSEQQSERVDLTEVIKNIETDLEVAIQQSGATLQYRNLPELEGAPVLLYQLFYNLINNSLKFVKPGTEPHIKIQSEQMSNDTKGFVRITVRDNGIGFEQDFAGRIFETFTRLHPKDRYDGTGLGLALCKKIVERHGGTIAAESTPGDGARFLITLPLTQNKDRM